jgi:hypothetical protein
VAPVRQQRLRAGTEHPADVRRVLERRVKVNVVGDREREQRLDVVERNEGFARQSALGRAQPGVAALRQ